MIIISILFLFYSFNAQAEVKNERYYQEIYCDLVNGATEFVLDDKSRVDCLTDDEAIEVDWASKWAECVGQALYYGAETNRKSKCLLIGNKEDYDKYSSKIDFLVKHHNLQFKVNWIEK